MYSNFIAHARLTINIIFSYFSYKTYIRTCDVSKNTGEERSDIQTVDRATQACTLAQYPYLQPEVQHTLQPRSNSLCLTHASTANTREYLQSKEHRSPYPRPNSIASAHACDQSSIATSTPKSTTRTQALTREVDHDAFLSHGDTCRACSQTIPRLRRLKRLYLAHSALQLENWLLGSVEGKYIIFHLRLILTLN